MTMSRPETEVRATIRRRSHASLPRASSILLRIHAGRFSFVAPNSIKFQNVEISNATSLSTLYPQSAIFTVIFPPSAQCDVAIRWWRPPTDYANVNGLLLTPTAIPQGDQIGKILTYNYGRDTCFTTYSNINISL